MSRSTYTPEVGAKRRFRVAVKSSINHREERRRTRRRAFSTVNGALGGASIRPQRVTAAKRRRVRLEFRRTRRAPRRFGPAEPLTPHTAASRSLGLRRPSNRNRERPHRTLRAGTSRPARSDRQPRPLRTDRYGDEQSSPRTITGSRDTPDRPDQTRRLQARHTGKNQLSHITSTVVIAI